MKKLLSIILVVTMIGVLFTGCKKTEEGNKDTNNTTVNGTEAKGKETGKKISVVTTIFPEYDWVREVVKGNDSIEVTMLLDKGVDLHSFQPTVDDIVKVSSCDMFIYVGGESDEWVEDVLAEATNKNMTVINLLELLGDSVKEEELVEGMEGEEEEEEEEEGEEEGPEYDEHVWLSLKNAEVICKAIAEEFGKLDESNKSLYETNAKNYAAELSVLDGEYKNAVEAGTVKTLLFGDRFPFRYLVDDYNLSYYAAFVGCSAESEASFETITFLAGKVDELGISTIMQIESADGKIAETIKSNTKSKDQKLLTMDSMQSVTAKDVENGATYLNIMKSNLEVLKEAVGTK